MKLQINRLCCLFLAAVCCISTSAHANRALIEAVKRSEARTPAPLLDRDVLLNPSRVFGVRLSPDGHSIAYMQLVKNKHKKLRGVWLYDIKTATTRKLFTTNYIRRFVWSNDSNSLFLISPDSVGVSKVKADPAPLVLINTDRKQQEKWLDLDIAHHDSFLVQLWDKTSEEYVVNRVNYKGEKTEIYRTKARFNYFDTDAKGNPLFVRELNTAAGNQGESFIFDISAGKKQLIWQCAWDDPCTVTYYDKVKERLLMKSNQDSDLTRLVWADIKTGQLTVLHQDPKSRADIKDFEWQASEVHMVSYLGDHRKTYGLTPSIQQHIENIEKAVDSPSLRFDTSYTQSIETTPWLVSDMSGQRVQQNYYLYHPKTKAVQPILKDIIEKANIGNPMIEEMQIATTVPVHYKASDGFELQGYVTFPPGINIKTAPLVANIHGGPWGRNDDEYDDRQQFLANRGYIVFQPNFRASTGFGKHYTNSVKGEFGDGRIQQDIIEGVQYLLNNNIGDRRRLAIVGHSFGGFSTLAGLSFTPELFKVGFAGAPPSDLGRSMKKYAKYEKKNQLEQNQYVKRQVVVDWKDPAAFKALHQRSPDFHADKITKPLMIWAGERDDKVFVVDVKDYALKLQSLGKKVSLFIDPKAGHGPSKQVGEQAYFYLLEKTLSEHIGGRLQVLDAKADLRLIRFLDRHMVLEGK